MSYQFLTAEDQAAIVAEVQASQPTSEQIVKAAEAAHYRATIVAKYGGGDPPDPIDYEQYSADAAKADEAHGKLDEEAGKLPAPPVKAEVAEVG